MSKNKITSFDFEAAFKALDEIEIPKVKGMIPNRENFHEAVKRVDKTQMLVEEYYDLGVDEEVETAADDREAEVAKAKLARIEKIVDLDADSPDELAGSYVGKYIIQCPQCMTMFYKEKEDLVPSEEDPTTVNVEEACQHCGNTSGYTLIGKVGEADNADTAEEEIPAEGEEEIPAEDEEVAEEETTEEEPVEEEAAEEEELPAIEEGEEIAAEESFKPAEGTAPLTEDAGKDSFSADEIAKLADEQSTSEAQAAVESADFKNNTIDDAAGAPSGVDVKDLKDVPLAEVENKTESFDVAELEDIEEGAIESAITESLTNVYENVKGFKLESCKFEGGNLILEGTITFASGNTRKSSYVFTEAKRNNNRATLYGINEGLNAKSRFAIRGLLEEDNKKFMATHMAYKYDMKGTLVEGVTHKVLQEKFLNANHAMAYLLAYGLKGEYSTANGSITIEVTKAGKPLDLSTIDKNIRDNLNRLCGNVIKDGVTSISVPLTNGTDVTKGIQELKKASYSKELEALVEPNIKKWEAVKKELEALSNSIPTASISVYLGQDTKGPTIFVYRGGKVRTDSIKPYADKSEKAAVSLKSRTMGLDDIGAPAAEDTADAEDKDTAADGAEPKADDDTAADGADATAATEEAKPHLEIVGDAALNEGDEKEYSVKFVAADKNESTPAANVKWSFDQLEGDTGSVTFDPTSADKVTIKVKATAGGECTLKAIYKRNVRGAADNGEYEATLDIKIKAAADVASEEAHAIAEKLSAADNIKIDLGAKTITYDEKDLLGIVASKTIPFTVVTDPVAAADHKGKIKVTIGSKTYDLAVIDDSGTIKFDI